MRKILAILCLFSYATMLHCIAEGNGSRTPEFGTSEVYVYQELLGAIEKLQDTINSTNNVLHFMKYKENYNELKKNLIQNFEQARLKLEKELNEYYQFNQLTDFQYNLLKLKTFNISQNINNLRKI
jgi:hypothetical protein